MIAEQTAVSVLPWQAQSGTGAVVGRLWLSGGTALAGVPILARNPATGERVTGATTDATGWFGVAELRPGLWLIEADLPKEVVGKRQDAVEVTEDGVVEASLSPLLRRR